MVVDCLISKRANSTAPRKLNKLPFNALVDAKAHQLFCCFPTIHKRKDIGLRDLRWPKTFRQALRASRPRLPQMGVASHTTRNYVATCGTLYRRNEHWTRAWYWLSLIQKSG